MSKQLFIFLALAVTINYPVHSSDSPKDYIAAIQHALPVKDVQALVLDYLPQNWSFEHTITTPVEVNHLSFSPDNKLAYADYSSAYLWQTQPTIKLFQTIPLSRLYTLISRIATGTSAPIVFSADGKYLAIQTGNSKIQIFEKKNGAYTPTEKLDTLNYIESLTFSPDHRYFAAGQSDNMIFLWSIKNNAFVPEQYMSRDRTGAGITKHGPLRSLFGVDSYLNKARLAFSTNGKYLAAGIGNKLHMFAYTDPQKSPARTGLLFELFGAEPRYRMILSTDVVASNPNARISDFEDALNPIRSIAFSPDSTLIAVATASEENTVKLWYFNNHKLVLLESLPLDTPPTATTFSPDGTTLVVSFGKTVQFWNIDQNKLTPGLKIEFPEWVNTIAFSPDGTYFAAAYGKKIDLYKSKTHILAKELGIAKAAKTVKKDAILTGL